MNDLFWIQAYGNKETLLASIASPQLRKFAEINYGPWDRLNDNAPFLDNVELKPLGSNFYPAVAKTRIGKFFDDFVFAHDLAKTQIKHGKTTLTEKLLLFGGAIQTRKPEI